MRQKLFVEIGTCDFDTLEPLLQNGWTGYFVEPVKKYADKLPKANTTNCCISSYDGEIDFYVSATTGEEWVKGISHCVFQQGTKLLEFEGNRQFLKEKISVKCYKLQTFLKNNNIKYIDYLKVDTEGHETDIFEAYDWSIKPTFIKLEHSHIDDTKMRTLLEKQGYLCYTENYDIYAIR